MTALLHNPIVIYLAVILFSSLLYALPKPGPQAHWIYVCLYRLLHILGANLDRVTESIKSNTGIDVKSILEPTAPLNEAGRPRLPTEIPQADSGPRMPIQEPETVRRE